MLSATGMKRGSLALWDYARLVQKVIGLRLTWTSYWKTPGIGVCLTYIDICYLLNQDKIQCSEREGLGFCLPYALFQAP